jgi:hypothetical protein
MRSANYQESFIVVQMNGDLLRVFLPTFRHQARTAQALALCPWGMSCAPDNDFRLLDDLDIVRSTEEPDDRCLLLFDPKNARRIFYVHVNRLLVHIGAFDPVHIGLLLSAKHSTGTQAGMI